MKKIVFITSSIGFGGASKMLCFVAESLAARGHDIHIINIMTTSKKGDYERSLSDKVTLHTVSGEDGRKGLRRLTQINGIKKIVNDINSDLIIGFTLMPNYMATIVGKLTNTPSIISERGDPYRTLSGKGMDKIFVNIINCSDGGVFQTEGAREFYGKRLRKRGKVIPNPIFVNRELPEIKHEDREKSVVSVGRLDNTQKRYDIMLKSFKIFHEKHPEYVLKLYGSGPDEPKIIEWMKELGLEDSVMLKGLTTRPMQDIANDGMFLITSDYEGIANAMLEAMAVGLPVVSTDSSPGGARMVITPGHDGLLAPIGDSEKIADAMCKFAENPEFSKSCGENAKNVLTRFAPEFIIDEWERYCIDIINRK